MSIALLATGRKKFVSIEGSYHGNSIGTMSVASSANREQFGNLLSNCKKIKPPLDERAISKVETALRGKDVAAFIMEPVIMNLGVMTPALGFMDELRRLCTRTGTALIFDEVACGFGRTGTMFATEHFDIEPDIMCLAKAITGGYAGLGAVIMSQSIAGEVEGEFAPWSTYGWHPLSVAAAIADVRYIIKHQLKLLRHVNEMGEYLRERLEQMAFQHEPVFRVKGLAIGVEFEQEGYADEIQERCFKEGLLVSGDDDVLMLLPALTVERATAEAGLDILERCV